MTCPSCEKEVLADRLFCTWCESFIPRARVGTKAGLFRRWFASAIDPMIVLTAVLVPIGFFGTITGETAGFLLGLAVGGMVVILFLRLFVRGMTPGKYLIGEQVVNRSNGANPGFVKMFVRETIGKFASGLFLGLGFFWAIWDKDGQAWHDKIAGTVVVRRASVSLQAETVAVP